MRKTERKMKRFLSVFLSFCMIFAMMTGMEGSPVRADMDEEDEGHSVAVYDCVWFGSYPQSEVKKGSELYETLSGLGESSWNSYRETLYQGKRYRRMKAYQANQYRLKDENYFLWGTVKEWRYFVYEPIKWRILSRENGKALLLADQAIDSGQYGGRRWESSTLRKWLNTETSNNNLASDRFYFMCYAFTLQEQTAIVSREVPADDSEGDPVTDRVSLPDMKELTNTEYGFKEPAQQKDDARSCTMTEFAFAMGAQSNGGSMSGSYWLRYHPGEWEKCIGYTGMYMKNRQIADTCSDICIRPMLMLDLSKTSCYEDAGKIDFSLPEGERVSERASTDPLRGCISYINGTGMYAWECVWWGRYPGQEVTEDNHWLLYQKIFSQPETEWKDDLLTLDDGQYLRAGPAGKKHYFAIQSVRWRVVQREEQGITLMADTCLDAGGYRDGTETAVWRESALSKWLNASGGLLGMLCTDQEKSLLKSTESGEKVTLPDPADEKSVEIRANGVFSDYARAVYQWKKNDEDISDEILKKNGWWLQSSLTDKNAGTYACFLTEDTLPDIYEEVNNGSAAETQSTIRGIQPVIVLPLSVEKDLVRAGYTLGTGVRDIIDIRNSTLPVSHPEPPAPSQTATSPAITTSPEIWKSPQPTKPLHTDEPLPAMKTPEAEESLQEENTKVSGEDFSSNIVRGMMISETGKGAVRLSWNVYTDAQGYEVVRKENDGRVQRIAIVSKRKKRYFDYTVKPKVTYYYSVRAYRRNGKQWQYSGYAGWQPIRLSVSISRPVLKVMRQKKKQLFHIRHGDDICGLSLEMKSAGGKYRIVKLGRQNRWLKTVGASTSFTMRIGSAKGIYYCRVRTYVIRDGNKYYSRYSKKKKITL